MLNVLPTGRPAPYAFRFRDKMRLWEPSRPVLQKLVALSALRHRLIGLRRQLEQPLAEQENFGEAALYNQLTKTCRVGGPKGFHISNQKGYRSC